MKAVRRAATARLTATAVGKRKNRKKGNIIDDYRAAEKHFTPKNVYGMYQRHKLTHDGSSAKLAAGELDRGWAALSPEQVSHYEDLSELFLAAQPSIVEKIVHALLENWNSSWQALADKLKVTGNMNYCTAKTVRNFVQQFDGFKTYRERVVPALSPQQKMAHVEHAKKVKNRWNRTWEKGQKFLFIHYDEKWFYGLVLRARAKMCPELGVPRQQRTAKNMHHINKVMAIATVGYYFTDEMRNGGEGILLSMYRSQKAKIAKKTQYPRVRRPDGTWYYDKSNGPLYRKGDPVMCDTVCVGSPKGTPSDPKFDLQTMWILNIFPLIEALVGDGGRCEGAQVVIQGDGAGPHRERAYAKRMTDECKERGWIWDTQAPHMPHSNVLDLYIFPAMSKNHDKERNSHSSMLSKEQIWENAEAVWNKITSQEIAKAFLVLDGVLDKVIKKKRRSQRGD